MNGPELFLIILGLGITMILVGIQSPILIPVLVLGVTLIIGDFVLFVPKVVKAEVKQK